MLNELREELKEEEQYWLNELKRFEVENYTDPVCAIWKEVIKTESKYSYLIGVNGTKEEFLDCLESTDDLKDKARARVLRDTEDIEIKLHDIELLREKAEAMIKNIDPKLEAQSLRFKDLTYVRIIKQYIENLTDIDEVTKKGYEYTIKAGDTVVYTKFGFRYGMVIKNGKLIFDTYK